MAVGGRLLRLAAAAGLALLASGCGGGGGGGPVASGSSDSGDSSSESPSPPPVEEAAAVNTYAPHSEYMNAWGLAAVNAADAYQRIADRDGANSAPGEGARVALIDDGIDDGHWEFDSSRITRSGPANARDGHGTNVASVIAARRGQDFPAAIPARERARLTEQDFHGVAWGIDSLEMHAIPLSATDPNRNYADAPTTGAASQVNRLANQISALRTSPDFVNLSFSIEGLVENYRNGNFGLRFGAAIQNLTRSASNGKTILVFAAGNAHGRKCESPTPGCVNGKIEASSPEFYAGLPVLAPSLRSHVVAVVATDRQGGIASFSNRCGVAAKWCIAAPGEGIRVATSGEDGGDRGYGTSRGTSFAAPFVTGGLAVMKHWFRSQLANEELLERLYLTARVTPDLVAPGGSCPAHLDLDNNRADCELSSELGRGLMDLGAATAPVGPMSFALNGGLPAQSSRLAAGPPIGDGMRRSLAGREAALFDELGAPFWVEAGRFLQEPSAAGLGLRLSRWLARSDGLGGRLVLPGRDSAGPAGSRLRFGFGANGAGHMSLAARPAAAEARFGNAVLSAFASTGADGANAMRSINGDAHGLALAWRPAEGPVGLHAGWIGETATLFGSAAGGAFGSLSSSLNFIGASGAFDLGGWRFEVAAEFGSAAPEVSGGLLAEGSSAAFSTAISAAATRAIGAGALELSVQQPLRVERGHLSLFLPAGRTPAGAVQGRHHPVSLEPSGRQLDYGVDWTQAFAPGAAWRLGAVLSLEPGHDAGRDAEALLLAGLRVRL